MALIDKASLLMVPSTYEDGTLYNVLPSGNKAPDETGNHNGYDQTRADFTFSRGSNLAATRVNADGLIEKGRENLLLQSNQFDTTWATNNASVTSGQSGYDGSSDAWKLQSSSAGINYLYQIISNNAVQTFSIYAKAGNTDWMRINILQSGTNANNYYDIANGVKGASPSAPIIEDKIEGVGNGWYRISIVVNISITQIRIQTAVADGNETSASGDNIFIQSAQLEKGLIATDYIETGSSTAQAGILEDMPRINYDANGENGALLLESSRTNKWIHSEYLDYSFSAISQATTTQNTSETKSPEGVYNATKLAGTSTWSFRDSLAGTDTGTWTISCYVKAVDANDKNTFRLSVSGNNFSSNLTATSEWKRFSFTVTDGGNTNAGLLRDTGGNDADLYIYGFQVEAGSYASSLIPTHGAAVTRGADVPNILGDSSVIGQSEGTLFFDAYFDINDRINISLSDSTSSNHITIDSSSNKAVFAYVQQGGSSQATISTGNDYFELGERLKCAIGYKANDFVFYINGTQIGTDTSGSVPTCDDIRFARYNGALAATQRVRQAALFDTRLTNSELATLTTL